MDPTPHVLDDAPRNRPRLPLLAMTGIALVLLSLGTLLGRCGTEDPDLAALAEVAADDPRFENLDLLSAESGRVDARILVDNRGEGYLINDRLRALPEGQTYQLWGEQGGELVSLGVFGNVLDVSAFRSDGVYPRYGISVEAQGAAREPDTGFVSVTPDR